MGHNWNAIDVLAALGAIGFILGIVGLGVQFAWRFTWAYLGFRREARRKPQQ